MLGIQFECSQGTRHCWDLCGNTCERILTGLEEQRSIWTRMFLLSHLAVQHSYDYSSGGLSPSLLRAVRVRIFRVARLMSTPRLLYLTIIAPCNRMVLTPLVELCPSRRSVSVHQLDSQSPSRLARSRVISHGKCISNSSSPLIDALTKSVSRPRLTGRSSPWQ